MRQIGEYAEQEGTVPADGGSRPGGQAVRKVYLIGMGPGDPAYLTMEARKAIRDADALLGSGRMLQAAGRLYDEEWPKDRRPAMYASSYAEETLRALTDAGHHCFVYTHRGASCLAILRQTGLLLYFTEVVTALDGFPRKPDPAAILYLMEKYHLSPAASFYVGDRSLDVEAANNAGIGSILFLDPSSPIKATGHETFVVKDLLEILTLRQWDTGEGTET